MAGLAAKRSDRAASSDPVTLFDLSRFNVEKFQTEIFKYYTSHMGLNTVTGSLEAARSLRLAVNSAMGNAP